MSVLVASDPPASGNDYVDSLYRALAPYGIELIPEAPDLRAAWLSAEGASLDALHFHWPEGYSRVQLRTLRRRIPWLFSLRTIGALVETLGRLLRVGQFRRFLNVARRRRISIIWSLHNFEPHEGGDWIDRLAYQGLYRNSTLIICHSNWSRRLCQDKHRPRGLTIVMKHGNFDRDFPPPGPRAEVLKDLGLRDDLPVLGCTGGIRDYKGWDLACEAVALSRGAWQLIIAGPPHPDFDLEGLRRRASGIPGAVLVARKLSNSEFSDVVSACDVILLPYRKITTCSMIIGAFTLGRGVVASDLPYFREILENHPEAGTLVKPGDPAALFHGIGSYLRIPQGLRSEAARKLGDTFDWDLAIRPVAQAFVEKIGRLSPGTSYRGCERASQVWKPECTTDAVMRDTLFGLLKNHGQ